MTNETTARQPKSIGDDAQFKELLWDFRKASPGAGADFRMHAIFRHLNSRAPAAQASATIQAEPEGYAFEVFVEYGGSRFFKPHWDRRIDLFDPRDDGKGDDPNYRNIRPVFAAAPAATIQEPVMVAEPVPKIRIALRQALRLVGFFGGHDADVTVAESADGLIAFCTECPEEGSEFLGATEVDDELAKIGLPRQMIKPSVDLIAAGALRQFKHNDDSPGFAFGYDKAIVDRALAAPMVADPAGVVVDAKFWPQGPTQIACSSCGLTAGESRVLDALKRGEMAATVKAVASEALELAGMVVKATFGDHKILVPRVDLSGKGIGTLVYFAAPLADKTGGAQ